MKQRKGKLKLTDRGSIKRQANKKMRRDRILDIAKHQIAKGGFDSFTFNKLAAEAGVSTPTIYNLFGKKDDILNELVMELMEVMRVLLHKPPSNDPIKSSEYYINEVVALFEKNEDFYRAAYMAAEKLEILDPRIPDGSYQEALQLCNQFCNAAKEDGYLLGNIETSSLAKQLFDCHRLVRKDWVAQHIDLEQYAQQVKRGFYIIYASDATPETYTRLCKEIKQLNIL